MFKFNFIHDEDENINEDTDTLNSDTEFAESKEIFSEESTKLQKYNFKNIETKVLITNNLEIKYISSDSLIEILKKIDCSDEDSILKADQNHSDLWPAIYEGGLKIWECTYDLLNYFQQNKIDFKEKSVLDLGCGAGILGIMCLLTGGNCWFQDYNKDVIQNITIPNILFNCEKLSTNSKFFSGDWNSFVKLIENKYPDQRFDYIITSETIYNTSYYNKLHLVFEKFLKKDGVIFLAAKSFYFGVGGGIHLFQDFLDKKKVFKHKNSWESTEGVKRNILKLEFV